MNKKQVRLPKEFKKYFWDVDFKKISIRKHFNYILSRILGFGNMKAIRWVLKNIDAKRIEKYVSEYGDRQLDKRSNNFWKLYFGLSGGK